jgi:succinyl-CoA:acetate CoA-transferase
VDIKSEIKNRIRATALLEKIIEADQAGALIKDGAVIGLSGFTTSGYARAVPIALAQKGKNGERFQIDVLTGASMGNEVETALTEAGIVRRRMPYQSTPACRASLNTLGGIRYQDQHLSNYAYNTRAGFYGDIDYAIIEVCAVTETGGLVPTTAIGNAVALVEMAKKVILELNLAQPANLYGIHDIYSVKKAPHTEPIPLVRANERIGQTYISCDPEKIAAIVINDQPDNVQPFSPIDDNALAIAGHLIDFFKAEVAAGRLPENLLPLQSGIGSVANAVLSGLAKSGFKHLSFFSEVVQDSVFDLVKAGVIDFCCGTGLTLSPNGMADFFQNLDFYKERMLLRPQDISNNPEVIRRLGIIAMNTAIEADIYGNVNSTHVLGTKMMNGIGGSGDFARNSYISIFMSPSIAKNGQISAIVPMVSHLDHTEHDVDIIVTEQGLADLRNKSPWEKAQLMIDKCAHPSYRPLLQDYFDRACQSCKPGSAHIPHILSEALSWHDRCQKTGSMLP